MASVSAKLATTADRESVLKMIDEVILQLPQGTVSPENYARVADWVLGDIDLGFFIIAEDTSTKEPVGLMHFSCQAVGFRNGNVFWLESAYAREDDEHIHEAMLSFLGEYAKTRKCFSLRLLSKKACCRYWSPIIKRMELTESIYFIYHIDTP